jgi:nitrogen-specific signal transduction histidine kinase
MQVFLNLIKNAAEAAGCGRHDPAAHVLRPVLRLRRKAVTGPLPLQIEVIDDGPGLPARHRRGSSSPLFRAAKTARGWAWRWSPRS